MTVSCARAAVITKHDRQSGFNSRIVFVSGRADCLWAMEGMFRHPSFQESAGRPIAYRYIILVCVFVFT